MSIDNPACTTVMLTRQEYADLMPTPKLTVAEVNQLMGAVFLAWATAWGVRLCYRFFKK